MDTTTVTLPKELVETYAEIARRDGRTLADVVRTALEIYAERASSELRHKGSDGASLPSWIGTVGTSDIEPADELYDRGRRFESLGAGESPNDGYDSTNHEDWLRKHWAPDGSSLTPRRSSPSSTGGISDIPRRRP